MKKIKLTFYTFEEAYTETMLQCESLSVAIEMLKLWKEWQSTDSTNVYEDMLNLMDNLEKGRIPEEEEENASLFVCVDDDILEMLSPFDGDCAYYPLYMKRDNYEKVFKRDK